MASNLKIKKFKGDNTQNVDTWLSMYKQYCSFYDLSDKKRVMLKSGMIRYVLIHDVQTNIKNLCT